LESSDERHLRQLRKALPKPNGVSSLSNTKQILFKKLESTGYETSMVPFASDTNPFGDIAALGIGIIVRDNMWGPDLLEQPTDSDENYWQIITAAQELAQNIVFIFIRHKDSANIPKEEVCHPKFKSLAKGPWPKKQPHVFLMSYWGRLNKKQMEVVRSCLSLIDRLEAKLTINQLLGVDVPVSDLALLPVPDSSGKKKQPKPRAPETSSASGGGWFFSNEKSKEKTAGGDEWQGFKKRLLKKNRKQMMLLMAAELHATRDRDKQFGAMETEVKQLRAEVARLKEQLAGKNSLLG